MRAAGPSPAGQPSLLLHWRALTVATESRSFLPQSRHLRHCSARASSGCPEHLCVPFGHHHEVSAHKLDDDCFLPHPSSSTFTESLLCTEHRGGFTETQMHRTWFPPAAAPSQEAERRLSCDCHQAVTVHGARIMDQALWKHEGKSNDSVWKGGREARDQQGKETTQGAALKGRAEGHQRAGEDGIPSKGLWEENNSLGNGYGRVMARDAAKEGGAVRQGLRPRRRSMDCV